MPPEHLPQVRVISTPVARIILLRGIGTRLRTYYEDIVAGPVPDRLSHLVDRLR